MSERMYSLEQISRAISVVQQAGYCVMNTELFLRELDRPIPEPTFEEKYVASQIAYSTAEVRAKKEAHLIAY